MEGEEKEKQGKKDEEKVPALQFTNANIIFVLVVFVEFFVLWCCCGVCFLFLLGRGGVIV